MAPLNPSNPSKPSHLPVPPSLRASKIPRFQDSKPQNGLGGTREALTINIIIMNVLLLLFLLLIY